MPFDPIDFVLINTRKVSPAFYGPPSELLGTNMLAQALSEGGTSVQGLPEIHVDLYGLEDAILSFFQSDFKGSVVAFSVASQSFALFKRISLKVREMCPKVIIIAGGPHFSIFPTVSKTLEMRLADAVISGHAGEFTAFFLKYRDIFESIIQGSSSKLRIPKGLYFKKNEKIVGTGIGKKLPTCSQGSTLIKPFKGGVCVQVLTNERCKNACDYCFSPRIHHQIRIDRELSVLKKFSTPAFHVIVDLLDNSPFAEKISFISQINPVSGRENKSEHIEIACYCDIGDIVTKGWDAFLQFLDTGGKYVYFGRDVVDETSAVAIGRRYRGSLRKKVFLDKEKNILKNLPDLCETKKIKLFVSVDYIFYPWMQYENAQRLIEEIETIVLLSTHNCEISVEFQILCPFPGTRFFKDKRGAYLPLEEAPEEIVDYWMIDGSAGCYFMKLIDFLVYPNNNVNLQNVEKQILLLKCAAFLSFGEGDEKVRNFCSKWMGKDKPVTNPSQMMEIFCRKLSQIDNLSPETVARWRDFEANRLELITGRY